MALIFLELPSISKLRINMELPWIIVLIRRGGTLMNQKMMRIFEWRLLPIICQVIVGTNFNNFLQVVIIVDFIQQFFRDLVIQPYAPWATQIIVLVHLSFIVVELLLIEFIIHSNFYSILSYFLLFSASFLFFTISILFYAIYFKIYSDRLVSI